jgi:hypothetical protein
LLSSTELLLEAPDVGSSMDCCKAKHFTFPAFEQLPASKQMMGPKPEPLITDNSQKKPLHISKETSILPFSMHQ